MSEIKIIYHCTQCDAQFPKWQGRCSECGAWGTIQKEEVRIIKKEKTSLGAPAGEVIDFGKIGQGTTKRYQTGIEEFDRVLGGVSSDIKNETSGLVAGSVVLLGGEPGVGKSTLILQIAEKIALPEKKVLYISGEESADQVKMRLDRLKLNLQHIQFFGETDIEVVVATIKKFQPRLAIIDSIQTVYFEELPSEAGTINQIKACAAKLIEVAKSENIPIIIIGHVTKTGSVAGPKTLEHLVDVVLYLEGDKHHAFRILRAIKNRFGSTNEVGVFDMQAGGMVEVKDPSRIFLSEKKGSVSGSIITAVLEGSRSFLVEIQALASWTNFGYPQRRSVGINFNRLELLIAVLSKRCGLNLSKQDIHVNVVAGLVIEEPAVDLAVCLAVASAHLNKPISQEIIAFGEVGLGGEIRPVNQMEKRLREAEKFGFKIALVPKGNILQSNYSENKKIRIIGLDDLNGAINEFVR